jgi:AraC-like DNA-binding protein
MLADRAHQVIQFGRAQRLHEVPGVKFEMPLSEIRRQLRLSRNEFQSWEFCRGAAARTSTRARSASARTTAGGRAAAGGTRARSDSGTRATTGIAALCGFADADTLRRAFARQVGVTPAEYRKRYAVDP